MEIESLDFQEKGLIEILRAFKFLRQENYHEKEIAVDGRSNPSIVYYNWSKNRIIKILGDESQSWTIVIQRKKFFDIKKADSFFDISDYYKTFGGSMIKGKNYSLKSQVEFIQQYLMPIVRGEIWIDELINH